MKKDLRKVVFGIAAELAEKAGTGAKPNAFLKEAWVVAKARYSQESPVEAKPPKTKVKPVEAKVEELKFYTVEYKKLKGGWQRSTVLAPSKEEAGKLFNNPEEVGLTADIKKITEPKRINEGSQVTAMNNGLLITGLLLNTMSTADLSVTASIKMPGKLVFVPLGNVIAANKVTKQSVL